jgi:hypothetical protein
LDFSNSKIGLLSPQSGLSPLPRERGPHNRMQRDVDVLDPLPAYLHQAEEELIQKTQQIQHLKEDEKKLESTRHMLKFLDHVPEKYKKGPWSPVAHLFIASFALFLMFTWEKAMDSHSTFDYSTIFSSPYAWLQTYRLLTGIYGLFNIGIIFYHLGIWPFSSYTLTSWNLMTLRLLSAYCASANIFTPYSTYLADFTRFPALVGCSVTVLVWWLALVPLISYLLSKSPQDLKFFWAFNFSFSLINLHLLNLPIIAIDFIYTGYNMHYYDLYCGLVVAFIYTLFYLNVLDPLGMQFYIILTPRSRLCVLSYGAILAGYTGLFHAWNNIVAYLPTHTV